MMLDTFQEVNHTLGLCPNAQKVVCEVTLGLCPKVQEVVCEAPPTTEDLIESKVEECFQDLPSEMPFVQYTQVGDALAPETALVFKSAHQVSPKVGKDFVGQLEDPLGMVFTWASFGYDVRANLLSSMVYDSRYIVDECLVKYYDDILASKRHAKWVIYLHVNIVVVDVQTKAHIEDGLLHDGYFSMPIVHSSFESNK